MNCNKFERLRNRLKEKADHPRARAVTFVALGDSVTQGCMGYGVVEYESVYHHALKKEWSEDFPARCECDQFRGRGRQRRRIASKVG
ncbi:hypothetical protein [Paenibacillus sp. GCM10027626]|uniref:hypothetical protein n=1 Tax=Paenibacillus sp. GCM10027626 TaxID=3273411 RepID=UPI00363EF200